VDALLREKDRAKARVRVPGQAYYDIDDTQPIPLVGGRAIGSAPVLNREKTAKIQYADYVRPEDLTVGWFLKRGQGSKTVMSTLESMITGGSIEKSFLTGRLRNKTRNKKVNVLTKGQAALGQ